MLLRESCERAHSVLAVSERHHVSNGRAGLLLSVDRQVGPCCSVRQIVTELLVLEHFRNQLLGNLSFLGDFGLHGAISKSACARLTDI